MGGVRGLDSDVQKLLADDCGHELSALELVTSFITDTQIQPLHVLVGLISGELETLEPNGCGAFTHLAVP